MKYIDLAEDGLKSKEYIEYWEIKYLLHVPHLESSTCGECGSKHYHWNKKGIMPIKKVLRKREKTHWDYMMEALDKTTEKHFERIMESRLENMEIFGQDFSGEGRSIKLPKRKTEKQNDQQGGNKDERN